MTAKPNGELIPVGGGDTIPLIREQLSIGRRDTCDISLRFPNISGMHAELVFRQGVWYIRDLGSTNGTKVNEQSIQQQKALRPGDKIGIAKRVFIIRYKMTGSPEDVAEEEAAPQKPDDLWGQSLLERAGLSKPQRPAGPRPTPIKPVKPLRPEDVTLRQPDEDDEDE
jgi:pSer/pThr/pTyr-binding forkhead associated (FHA) protein